MNLRQQVVSSRTEVRELTQTIRVREGRLCDHLFCWRSLVVSATRDDKA